MASLVKHARHTGLALAIALGLMVLTTVTSPLLGDELANLIGPTAVSAEETAGSGG